MKALVLRPWTMPLRTVPDPVPADDDLLIDVHSVGICGRMSTLHRQDRPAQTANDHGPRVQRRGGRHGKDVKSLPPAMQSSSRLSRPAASVRTAGRLGQYMHQPPCARVDIAGAFAIS